MSALLFNEFPINMFVLLKFLNLLVIVLSLQHCDQYNPQLRYYKIRNCYKSDLPIVGSRNMKNVKDCMRFARERRGFAFNYSPPEVRNLTRGYLRNCQVLGCPEVGNSTTLVPDPRFDYYSAYGNFKATQNATCFRTIGLFALYDTKTKYIEAIGNCQNLGGDLANILSEQRNYAISSLTNSISGWYKSAYIGLDDLEMLGKFKTPMGYLLDCIKFRAWSPGYPRKHKTGKCVILDVEKTWRSINCTIKLPYICEFYPESPHIPAVEITNVNCTRIRGKKKRAQCLNDKKLYELYKSSPRLDQCALLNQDDLI